MIKMTRIKVRGCFAQGLFSCDLQTDDIGQIHDMDRSNEMTALMTENCFSSQDKRL